MCGRLILHFVPTKLRNIEEEGAKDSDFFNVYYAGESTFVLRQKKRYQKKNYRKPLRSASSSKMELIVFSDGV